MPPEPLLTAAEIAPLFRVSPQTIYRWADDGTIPSIKISGTVRFRRSEIDAFLIPAEPEPAEASA